MPITVRHGPDLRLLGAGGLLAGYGDFQKWQVEQQQREAQLALQRQAQAEQSRRFNQGIFADQQRDLMRMQLGAYENERQRQHQFDLGEDRFQQQAALREAQFSQQQQLQDQRLQSNEDLQFQREEAAYQQSVADAQQRRMDWSTVQQRERANIEQSLLENDNHPHRDASQKAFVRRALTRKMHQLGPPNQPKPSVMDDTEVVTHPVTGKQMWMVRDRNGIPTPVEDQSQAEQFKLDLEREKAANKIESDRVKSDTDQKKAKMDLAERALEALIRTKKIMGPADPLTGKSEQVGEETVFPTDEEVNKYMGILARVGGAASDAINQTQQGLPPIPQQWQDWQAGMQPQVGPQPQAPPAQPPPQDAQVFTSKRTGKQYTLAGLQAAAAKAGIPLEQLKTQLQIQ